MNRFHCRPALCISAKVAAFVAKDVMKFVMEVALVAFFLTLAIGPLLHMPEIVSATGIHKGIVAAVTFFWGILFICAPVWIPKLSSYLKVKLNAARKAC